MIILEVILLVIGFTLLTRGADYFIDNAAAIAEDKGITPHVVGVTIVAFGTSLPELLVSLISSYQGYNDLALGNIVGSNISNIGLVLGTSCFIFFYILNSNIVPEKDANSDSYVMLLAVVLLYFLAQDKNISSAEGVMFFGLYIIYMVWLYQRSLKLDIDSENNGSASYPFLFGGLVALLFGAQLTVDSAVKIATFMGISEVVIGLSVVAIGTSLPELAGTVSAARKGHKEIAVGNVIGSNIANIFLVMGVLAIVKPIAVDDLILVTTMPLLIIITITTFAMIRVPMTRLTGAIFFGFFALFLYQLTL